MSHSVIHGLSSYLGQAGHRVTGRLGILPKQAFAPVVPSPVRTLIPPPPPHLSGTNSPFPPSGHELELLVQGIATSMMKTLTAVTDSMLLAAVAVKASTQHIKTACPTVLGPNYQVPLVAGGWTGQIIASGLASPRGIRLDHTGALLVVEAGRGIQRLVFDDYGATCLVMMNSTTVVSNENLTHGIELSQDGKTLYASTSDSAFSWPYDAATASVGERRTLVTNMSNTDHVTRTLLLSRKTNGTTLLISRGSESNMDPLAQQLDSGHSQIKAFNLDAVASGRPYDFPSEGTLLGWGLRNSVGIAEHPVTGGIYSVENSADGLVREGVDIHEDNPGEELNFHGFLNGSMKDQGGNYGFPDCFALWDRNVPDASELTVGSQFALIPNQDLGDTQCAEQYVAPRLTFPAHMAPLDLVFTSDGSTAYVTFHGSWDRDVPIGYKVSVISFVDGDPLEVPASATPLLYDVLQNANVTQCPGNCFRPVGLVLDQLGRLFLSFDKSGEIIVLQSDANLAAQDVGVRSSNVGAFLVPQIQI